MNRPNITMGPLEWTLLIILSVLWGGSFFFVGVAVKYFSPLTVAALRVSLAALVLCGVVRALGLTLPRNRRLWASFFFMGLLNNIIPFSLIAWGQSHIASGLASILNAAAPLFTVIAAHFLTDDEKMTGGRLAGVGLGFLGVAVLVGPKAILSPGQEALAQAAVLGAAASYALAGIFGRRFRRLGAEPLAAAAGQVTASALVLIPLALAVERPWELSRPGGEVWGAILGLALFSTALAYIIYFRILKTAGATNVLLVTLLIPVSAVLLGAAVLGEAMRPEHLAGMGLIGLGILAIDGRPLNLLRNKPPEETGLGKAVLKDREHGWRA